MGNKFHNTFKGTDGRMRRTCYVCKKTKLLSVFLKNRCLPLGRGYVCKLCQRIVLRNRSRTPTYREYYRKRYRLDYGEQYIRNLEAKIKSQPLQYKARRIIENLVSRGKLIRKPCTICNEQKAQAHHPDHTKPYEIVWLCRTHHGEVHRKYERRRIYKTDIVDVSQLLSNPDQPAGRHRKATRKAITSDDGAGTPNTTGITAV